MIAKKKRKIDKIFKKYFDAKYSKEYIEMKGGINKYR